MEVITSNAVKSETKDGLDQVSLVIFSPPTSTAKNVSKRIQQYQGCGLVRKMSISANFTQSGKKRRKKVTYVLSLM